MSGSGSDESIHVQTRGDLRRDRFPDWEDPEGLARIPNHHRVMALDNPLSNSEHDPIRAYLVIDERIAGRVNLIMGRIQVEGEPVDVLWGFDLLVSPRFRGRGVATKLLRCWQDLRPISLGTNINLASVGIYRKLGWTTFETPTRALVMRSRPFVTSLVGSRLGGTLLAPACDLALAARRRLARLADPAIRGLSAEPCDAAPTEWDTELRRTARPVATYRSAAWINFMLRAGRADATRDYYLRRVTDVGGTTRGFFLFRLSTVEVLAGRFRQVRVAMLRDWRIFGDDPIEPASLMSLAATNAQRLGADTFIATALDAVLDRRLGRLGFRSRQPLRTAYHASVGTPLADERFRDPHVWSLTSVEADGLFV